MKTATTVIAVLFLALVVGCGGNDGLGPAQDQVGSLAGVIADGPSGGEAQPKFYSLSGTDDISEGLLNLIQINTHTGAATTIWKLGVSNTATEVVSPFGLAFDVDGTMYTIISWLDFIEGHQKSRVARVDMKTGVVTYIGPYIPLHFAGPDIDACGNLYATSFTVGDPACPECPPYVFGDNCLYRFDKVTGAATRIGNTGRGDWMDLAFDSQGRLWATTKNKLFILNTNTGSATFVRDIIGIPNTDQHVQGIPPEDWPYMEVMTIAFDKDDVLWATAMRGFSLALGNGLVLRINVNTGQAHIVGYTGKPYNHGGDIMPAKVRVCHKTGNGKYNTITISMNALPAHLAHGDIVPGAAGNSCDCP